MLWRWRFRGEDKILLSAVLKTHLHVSHFPPALSPSSSFLIPLSVMLMILPFGALRYPDSSQRILAGRNRVGGSRAASSLIFFFGSDLPVTSCKTIAHVPTDTPPTHTETHTHTPSRRWTTSSLQIQSEAEAKKGQLYHTSLLTAVKTQGRQWEGLRTQTDAPSHIPETSHSKKKHDDMWRYWSVGAAKATAADVCKILASQERHKLSRGWRGEPGVPSWVLAQKAWMCQRNDDRYG